MLLFSITFAQEAYLYSSGFLTKSTGLNVATRKQQAIRATKRRVEVILTEPKVLTLRLINNTANGTKTSIIETGNKRKRSLNHPRINESAAAINKPKPNQRAIRSGRLNSLFLIVNLSTIKPPAKSRITGM